MHRGAHDVAAALQSGDITYILFDLDGTLYESSAGIEAQLRDAMVSHASRFLGIEKSEARTLLRYYRAMYTASVIGLQKHHSINPVAFYEAVYDSLDVSAMTPRLGCVDAIKRLAQHVPLGVFTNSNRSFTSRTLMFLGLIDFFERVVTVEDHGFIRKPQIAAYDQMFDSLQRPPEQVLMFDDITSSLEVMDGMGAHGVLVGNGLRPYPHFVDLHTDVEYDGPPPYVMASTHDIVAFISEINNILEGGQGV